MNELFSQSEKYLIPTYRRFNVVFEKGEGVYLYDETGNRYLDFLAGIAVNSLGHCHPVVVDAAQGQLRKLVHVSNLYHIRQQTELAKLLAENSCCDKAFFCNSGAEANEAAIKLARKYHSPQRFKILSAVDSFHGRTLASLALTGQIKYHKGFKPMPEGFDYFEFNEFDSFLKKVDSSVAAVFVEFIQGEGGINVAKREFIEDIYSYCKKNSILFIADEIQTGIGRTGKLFAYEHYGIEPDIITLAKGLGGGFPIGCVLAKEDVALALNYGSHGSTFGGNPFVSAVSKAVVKYILDNSILDHVTQMGNYLMSGLREALKGSKDVESIRGIGLMVGIEFSQPKKAEEIVAKALENKILIGKAGMKTVRLEPPLIIEKGHIDEVIDFFEKNV